MNEGTTGAVSVDSALGPQPTLLKSLVLARGWKSYPVFCREYERVARNLGGRFRDTEPSRAQYKRWLGGQTRIPRREACAVLRVMFPGYSVEELFEPCGNAESRRGSAIGERREVDDVNRKDFLIAIGTATVAPGALLSAFEPARVERADLIRLRENFAHLYALDDMHGATGETYGLTVRTARHVVRLLDAASYSPDVGDQLHSLSGELIEHAGWLAFDAGRRDEARRWWLEALLHARMGDDPDIEAIVLASMSNAAGNHKNGRQAVDLALNAAKIARRGRSTPRFQSMLAAREAMGHAHLGDFKSAAAALDRAHVGLDRGAHDDDSAWLNFWGPPDLASYTKEVALVAGESRAAEESARRAVAAVDASQFPRNHASYQASLGGVLAERDLDEALPVIAQAAQKAANLNSARVRSKVKLVVSNLRDRHGDVARVRELADWTKSNLEVADHWPEMSIA